MSGLGAVVHQKGRVLLALTHIKGSKVERALDTSSLLKNDGQGLVHASGGDFDKLGLVLAALDGHFDFFVNQLRKSTCKPDPAVNRFIRLDLETGGFDQKEGFGASHFFQGKVALDTTFIFYFNDLIAGFTVWNVPEVNHRFKLDVRSWAQCVHL